MRKIIFFLCFSISLEAYAENLTINGEVKDQAGNLVSGASIYPEHNKTDIVLSDESGVYYLYTVPPEDRDVMRIFLNYGEKQYEEYLKLNPDETNYRLDWEIENKSSVSWYVVGKPMDPDGNTPENWAAFYKGEPLREEDGSFILGPLSSTKNTEVVIEVTGISGDNGKYYGKQIAKYEDEEYSAIIIDVKPVDELPQHLKNKTESALNPEEIKMKPAPAATDEKAAQEYKPGEIIFIDGPSVGGKLKKNGLVLRFVNDNREVEELTEKDAFFHLKNEGYIDSRGKILDKLTMYLNDIVTDPDNDIRKSVAAIFEGLNNSDVEAAHAEFSKRYWGDSFFRSYEQIPSGITRLLGVTEGKTFRIEILGITYKVEKDAYEAETQFELMNGEKVEKKGILKTLHARDDGMNLKLVKISGIRFIRTE